MHRNVQNTSVLCLRIYLLRRFSKICHLNAVCHPYERGRGGVENNTGSVKPQHSLQMVFLSTAQVTYMTKGEEARGEHSFFCKTENSRHLSSRKNACLSAGQIFKNFSQCLSLIGLPRLFTHLFPSQVHKSQSSLTPSHQWQAHKSHEIAKIFFPHYAINFYNVKKHFIIQNILKQQEIACQIFHQ